MIIHYIQLRIIPKKSSNLKKNFELLQVWFYENHMVIDPGKDHYLIIHKDIANESIELIIDLLIIDLLIIDLLINLLIIDKNFQGHKKSIIKTRSQKLNDPYHI